jgi:hypothetical protein
MQPYFAFHHPVFADDELRVAENFSGFFKADAVLPDVRPILGLIPLEANCHPASF